MDQGTVGEDPHSRVDISDPRTMSKAGCPDCFGRGLRLVVVAGSDNTSGLPEICHCVVSYLKHNPVQLLEFLKMREQTH
jgi:hypothetical protein